MIKDANPLRMAQQPSARLAGLRTVYAAMLRDSAENIVRAVMAISQGPAPVLVHCAAGKDRTGVVIAVTLAAIGAPREAIVGDYRRTEAAMPGVMTRLRQDWSAEGLDEALERLARERPDLLSAPASAIEGVLDTLAEHDGAAGGWLVDRGLAPGALGALTERLVAEDGAIAEAC